MTHSVPKALAEMASSPPTACQVRLHRSLQPWQTMVQLEAPTTEALRQVQRPMGLGEGHGQTLRLLHSPKGSVGGAD